MAKLYVVATPIGNLKDITLRAIDVLKSVGFVIAEDTRVAKKLLTHFKIKKEVVSYHKYSNNHQIKKIIERIKSGESAALTTDAGTPGISDPGTWVVKLAVDAGIVVVPIPGPSSVSTVLSVTDIDVSTFVFLGFPPHKKGRQTFFKNIVAIDKPVVLFESPHRIRKTLEALESVVGDRYLTVGRELTKMHEDIFRGTAHEALIHINSERERGEFVIVISKE